MGSLTYVLLNGERVVSTIEHEPACYRGHVRMAGACSTEPRAAYTIGRSAWTRRTLSNFFALPCGTLGKLPAFAPTETKTVYGASHS